MRDDLLKVQKRRDFLYKISNNYLSVLFNGKITYIDYLNMEELKREIEDLNNQGKKIVREIVNGGV